ncbi:MAG: phenylalanine--tRNA ligase subunit beta [Pirellulaceae bacterium]|nr:phenylalanine--tRNA ligase subunit beta [Pirellulaceae bacterium]
MLVSKNWLQEYVSLDMDQADLEERLTMSGLNHEGNNEYESDLAIDLEVTSNRPDCLGHLGVAREIGLLYGLKFRMPKPKLEESSKANVKDEISISIEATDLAPYYSARIIQGVKIGESPDWLKNRLQTVGIASVNNVVDISNYVLMECGQPLHVFDRDSISGNQIIVRRAVEKEKFHAINHKEYELSSEMCVIADANGPIALGGVMGGAESEVTEKTVNLLIEAADFAPLAIRHASRTLNLPSDSSYRFERGVDPKGIDWASRRCCELILEIAGGTLLSGVATAGELVTDREPITLRLNQVERILGISISPEEIEKILLSLELTLSEKDANKLVVVPPTFRRDLTREIDLIEEIARVFGYEKIPVDARVPMAASHKTDQEHIFDKIRLVMQGVQFCEAMSASVVSQKWSDAFSPWTDEGAITTDSPMLRGADHLRRTVVSSLLGSKKFNETLGNHQVDLYELAKIYLPQKSGAPEEPTLLSLASSRDFLAVKGVLELLLSRINSDLTLTVEPSEDDFFAAGRGCRLILEGELWGFLGEVSAKGQKLFGLKQATTVAEIKLDRLLKEAVLIPTQKHLSKFPTIKQDINLVVGESVLWQDLHKTIQASAGNLLEKIEFQEIFRAQEEIKEAKKRVLFSVTLRALEKTLTREEATAVREEICRACEEEFQAKLLS